MFVEKFARISRKVLTFSPLSDIMHNMKDSPLTVFTLLVAVDSSTEYLDSIHASKQGAEKRKAFLVEELGYLDHDVEIEPRPVHSL